VFEFIKTMMAGDAIVSAGVHLVVSPAYLSSDPEAAGESVKRLIAMNLDLERLLVGHGDDIYEDAKSNLSRIFAGPRPSNYIRAGPAGTERKAAGGIRRRDSQ
jgi:glyoxylase-like metal-dependent hydrolase (beta-lactamase superfamily II)